MGAASGMAYYTGFMIEKSLSMDNVFVIALIFSFAIRASTSTACCSGASSA